MSQYHLECWVYDCAHIITSRQPHHVPLVQLLPPLLSGVLSYQQARENPLPCKIYMADLYKNHYDIGALESHPSPCCRSLVSASNGMHIAEGLIISSRLQTKKQMSSMLRQRLSVIKKPPEAFSVFILRQYSKEFYVTRPGVDLLHVLCILWWCPSRGVKQAPTACCTTATINPQ